MDSDKSAVIGWTIVGSLLALFLISIAAGTTIYNIKDDIQNTKRVEAACQASPIDCQTALFQTKQ